MRQYDFLFLKAGNWMTDILFKTDNAVFSYRAAGILIRDGKVLLQKPTNDTGYAFPGGHVAFGETNEETLIREFKEEIAADIKVNELKWVGELFFPWGERSCHQICLYYAVSLKYEAQIPLDRNFFSKDRLDNTEFALEFCWVDICTIENLEVYPTNAKKFIKDCSSDVKHFVYKEN